MRDLLLVCSLMQFSSTILGNRISVSTKFPCPSMCQCEVDSALQLVDCSDHGLTSVPTGLDSHTFILDLSTNNISELQPKAFEGLHLLAELRLSGNHLRRIPGLAFTGLHNLQVLMLQNNQIQRLPSDYVWDLPNILSLRLDANLIPEVPHRIFSGLQSLRHLWLDDNVLTEVPTRALGHLSSLQALTLAMNNITYIRSAAFHNLPSLVVLHLHHNKIQTLEPTCFEGLHSLEILDMNHNVLQRFPMAITTLAKLRELSLNRAKGLDGFPNLIGTNGLEALHLTGTGLTSLPQNLCEELPRLKVLELSQNQIEVLPSFSQCRQLQEIYLQSNLLQEIGARTFSQLDSLQSLDLSHNRILTVHQDAFASLKFLSKLDLTDNLLTSLPAVPLGRLTHLRLTGNLGLTEDLRGEDFPAVRIVEMPYAYQCCIFGPCNHNYVLGGQPQHEATHKRTAALFHKLAISQSTDLEEFLAESEGSKPQSGIHCIPIPGPFKPCKYLFDGWAVRVGIWSITLISLVCNSLLVWIIFISSSLLSPPKFLTGSICGVNLLTGLCMATLALVDAWTFGEFSKHGAQWESGSVCQIIGFVSVFSSEASILFLCLAAVQGGITASHVRVCGKTHLTTVRAAVTYCTIVSIAIAILPLFKAGKYNFSPLCIPTLVPGGQTTTVGFTVGLIGANTLCFILITGTIIKLYWHMSKGDSYHLTNCAVIKHLAFLGCANVLTYSPFIYLTVSSLTDHLNISTEAVISIQLILLHLPASLNPLFHILFSPHLVEDLCQLCKTSLSTQPTTMDLFNQRASIQALVSIPKVDVIFDTCGSVKPDSLTKASPAFTVLPRLPPPILSCP